MNKKNSTFKGDFKTCLGQQSSFQYNKRENKSYLYFSGGLGYLPGGHLPPPKFGHYHPQIRTFPTPQKKHLPGGQLPPPFFLLFLAHFSWLFRLTAHGGHQGWEGGGA